jgi:hypothetical protein
MFGAGIGGMMKNKTKPIPALIIFLAIFSFCGLVTSAHADPDVGLWLARSCIGEGTWDSAKTTECAAIAYVYKKRMRFNNLSYYKNMRLYSSALKKKKRNINRWVRHMNRDLSKPKYWPSNVRWAKYRPYFEAALKVADDFLLGKVKDPLPNAVHYGCLLDDYRAKNAGWIKLNAGLRNFFYRVPGVKLVK